jgi:SlyX protein
MHNDALEQIQTKIAFLERSNAELSDMVFRQHQDLEALRAKVNELSQRLEAALSAGDEPAQTEERPPHY